MGKSDGKRFTETPGVLRGPIGKLKGVKLRVKGGAGFVDKR